MNLSIRIGTAEGPRREYPISEGRKSTALTVTVSCAGPSIHPDEASGHSG